jgi:hypothetical protein
VERENSRIDILRCATDAWQMPVLTVVNDDKVRNIVDSSLKGAFNQESMSKVITLAIKCIDTVITQRPDMKQVVRVLKEAAEPKGFNEILVNTDQDTNCPPIAEGEDEQRDDIGFNFTLYTNIIGLERGNAIVIPR